VKHRYKLRIAFMLLAVVHAAIVFAGFLAPYGFASQDRELPFAQPTRLHFFDTQGSFHARPFVYGLVTDPSQPNAYVIDSTQEYPIHFFVAGAPYKIAGLLPARMHFFGIDEPGRILLFGSDAFGRDQFSRFLYGGQLSLLAGLLAAAISVTLGMFIGGLAGFYGGWIDEALMRGGDLFLALPWLYLLFAVRAALPLHVSQRQVFVLLVAVMGLIGWARPARLIRGVALSAKERNFVLAARGFGASNAYILRRHVLPQAYVTLTFLGLGVGEPMPSWGSLLSSLQQYYVLASYWWMFLPALFLMPLFLAYYVAADALQERLKSVPL
jgi:peptide/nickel transport system permease protein